MGSQCWQHVLCFAENVPEGIHEILKNATPERIEASFQRKCKQKSRNYRWKSNFTKPSKNDFDFETTQN
jgi:hypothetical protein